MTNRSHASHMITACMSHDHTCSYPTYPRHPRQFIVNHCSHMELQHLDVFLDDVRGGSVLLVPDQLLIGLHNVSQLVSQVILYNGKSAKGGLILIDAHHHKVAISTVLYTCNTLIHTFM